MKIFKAATLVLTLLIMVSCTDNEKSILKKADRIHSAVLTVDTHCDTLMRLMRLGFDLGNQE
ncbi:MAG: hypothetical protein R2727_00755 [Bacteroidales bacterium]